MSATNSTPNYGLPQYVADDKPTYLGDFNKAMLDIDTNMKTIDNKATSNVSEIATANANATQANETANTANETAQTALATANTAKTTADTAKTTADTANSTATTAKNTADTANTNASQALTKANEAVENSNKIVFNQILESDQQVVNIPNLDFLNNVGYHIYINGTTEKNGGTQGDLMTVNAQVPNVTKLINRMMGLQITPASPTVDKIQNDEYQNGLVLNRFTSGLGGISKSTLQFRPNTGTDNSNLLHCISEWGIANNLSGSCGLIASSFRGENMTNVTQLNITAGSDGVFKAGTRIVVEKI